MDEQTPVGPREDELNRCRRVLSQVHALATRGLTQANAQLPLADEEADWEGWALWRGYRRAMLEVLAVTDGLELPEVSLPAPAPGRGPSGASSGEGTAGAKPA